MSYIYLYVHFQFILNSAYPIPNTVIPQQKKLYCSRATFVSCEMQRGYIFQSTHRIKHSLVLLTGLMNINSVNKTDKKILRKLRHLLFELSYHCTYTFFIKFSSILQDTVCIFIFPLLLKAFFLLY